MASKVEEKVTIQLPYIEGKGDTVYVGVNGVGYLVKVGEPVEVPASVAEVLRNANHQLMVVRQTKKQMKDQNLGEV